MKIKRILAGIILSASALLLPQKSAAAGTFYFHLDFGNFPYTFYPYRHDLWPVYDPYYFSSPYHDSYLHYHFPLISYYYQSYYPRVPYNYYHYTYSLHFYRNVYSYYVTRPYVHRYGISRKTAGYNRHHHAYYKPDRRHEHYDAVKTRKYYYSDRDFRHFRKPHTDRKKSRHAYKPHKKEKHYHRGHPDPAEIAGRLIHKNRPANKQPAFIHYRRTHPSLQADRHHHRAKKPRDIHHQKQNNLRKHLRQQKSYNAVHNRKLPAPARKNYINRDHGKKHHGHIRGHFERRKHANHGDHGRYREHHSRSGKSFSGRNKSRLTRDGNKRGQHRQSLSRHKTRQLGIPGRLKLKQR